MVALFDSFSAGVADFEELGELYRRARGETLPKKLLEEAMKETDADGSGVCLQPLFEPLAGCSCVYRQFCAQF